MDSAIEVIVEALVDIMTSIVEIVFDKNDKNDKQRKRKE